MGGGWVVIPKESDRRGRGDDDPEDCARKASNEPIRLCNESIYAADFFLRSSAT